MSGNKTAWERDRKRNNMRNDSRGGREGRFNYGMFQVISDSNNYLQLLCTFSFHSCNYYVIMWIIQFALNTWTVAEGEEGETRRQRKQEKTEERRGGGKEMDGVLERKKECGPLSSLHSRLIPRWPFVLGDWKVQQPIIYNEHNNVKALNDMLIVLHEGKQTLLLVMLLLLNMQLTQKSLIMKFSHQRVHAARTFWQKKRKLANQLTMKHQVQIFSIIYDHVLSSFRVFKVKKWVILLGSCLVLLHSSHFWWPFLKLHHRVLKSSWQ